MQVDSWFAWLLLFCCVLLTGSIMCCSFFLQPGMSQVRNSSILERLIYVIGMVSSLSLGMQRWVTPHME